ncbi:hypothetical protein ODV13_10245 [Lactobacillus amylovorus]|uniref:Uncharacterized protein n=1 Tax=Lactobacillus amylovorus TaxID=1604 RepID=A0A9X3W8A0_LACAM|nr:hypothetical protein [Lactobacillus amylovorus]MDB6255130.1 hypothetical protein [Lactobacillus amylovorus]MDB6259037.1 hypothetical protein [Lactobacillus amylovorus]
MKTALHKELKTKKTFSEKARYLFYAYKFEIIVFTICFGFIVFFGQSILFRSKPVLNVGVYTTENTLANGKDEPIRNKFNNLLHISNNRESVQVMSGSTKKISDEIKMQSLLSAGQIDILITNKAQFNQLNKHKNAFRVLPNKFTNQFNKSALIYQNKKVIGIKAKNIKIFQTLINSDNDILCVPTKGEHHSEAFKLLNALEN